MLSARYGGGHASDQERTEKLLMALNQHLRQERTARFVCCMALAGWAMGRRADAQPIRRHDRVSGRGRFSHPDLWRLFPAPGHRDRPSASELDTGREIPLSDFFRLHVCDSSAARAGVAAHTGLRISIKGSCGRPAGSAADLGRKRVARSQSISLCIYESIQAGQHLSCSRAVIISPRSQSRQRL